MGVVEEEILLVYDKECPACDNYCQVVRIRESVGKLVIVNARESSVVMQEITALGLDIDQGMVLKMGGEIYYGSDAIHALALISSRSGMFNKLNYWMFKSKRMSYIFYPVLRFLRNILLKLLSVRKINNLNQKGNEKF
jgi:predicted DCC family thiol-disulfide oxidoreductase YuxK